MSKSIKVVAQVEFTVSNCDNLGQAQSEVFKRLTEQQSRGGRKRSDGLQVEMVGVTVVPTVLTSTGSSADGTE